MKRFQILSLMVALGVGLGLAVPAFAVVNPVMDFGTGYASEGLRTADGHISTAGDNLVIVGHVVLFNDPFGDLDANDPTVEYTYVYDNLVSLGTVVIAGVIYDTNYSGGRLRVFSDPSKDSDFADKATFENGTLLLEVVLSNFIIHTDQFGCSGSQNADLSGYTGGTLVDRLAACGGVITGLFSVCSSTIPSAQQGQGYFGLSDTKMDADCTVPIEKSNWGEIKKLYQD